MRQRQVLGFRTPQHPSLGTNSWGGASPLLARNVPKASLEQRYSRLNSIRIRDEIFPAADEYFEQLQQQEVYASKYEVPAPTPTPSRDHRGLLLKLLFPKKEKTQLGGSASTKKRWFPRWDHRKKWPNGWCLIRAKEMVAVI